MLESSMLKPLSGLSLLPHFINKEPKNWEYATFLNYVTFKVEPSLFISKIMLFTACILENSKRQYIIKSWNTWCVLSEKRKNTVDWGSAGILAEVFPWHCFPKDCVLATDEAGTVYPNSLCYSWYTMESKSWRAFCTYWKTVTFTKPVNSFKNSIHPIMILGLYS